MVLTVLDSRQYIVYLSFITLTITVWKLNLLKVTILLLGKSCKGTLQSGKCHKDNQCTLVYLAASLRNPAITVTCHQ